MIIKRGNEEGAILIISLWILAILTVLAIGFAFRMSIELRLTGYQIARVKAFYLAKAGMVRALSLLEGRKEPKFDALNQPWNNSPEIYKEIRLGEGGFTVSHVPVAHDSKETAYGVVDEERKINVNFATSQMLQSLPGINSELAASIIDWRDQDNKPRPGGAEDFYYQSLSIPYSCKNGDFESVEELLLVKGVTPAVLAKVRDWITVYGEGKVNINTCDKEVLAALDLGDALVQKIISFRNGTDNLEGTRDDNAFEKAETIAQDLSQHHGLAAEELKRLNDVLARNLFCVKSKHFTINSIGYLQHDRTTREICTVVRVEKDTPTQIVYWHET